MATIENFLLRFKVDGQQAIDKASAGIKSLSDQVSQFGTSIGPLDSALNGILGKLGPVGLAAGAAAGAFAALGLRAIAMADELSDMADATGISAGALQNFRTSVIEAGGKADDFVTIAAKLNQSVQEAAGGNEKLQKAFQTLGVYVTDTGGNIRSTETILQDITEKFRNGEISGAQYAAAIDLLGKNINKLDLTKLNAMRDPVADADIRRLAEYQAAIDRIRDRLERQVISFFGQVALDIETAYEKADKIEKKFEEMGKKTYLGPGLRGFLNSILGREPTEPVFSREMTPAEKAARDKAAFEAEMARRMAPAVGKPRGRTEAGEGGGYGATPEATLKAIADSKSRIEQAQLEAKKQLELRAADEISRIQISASYDIEKARADIFGKERLSEQQKTAEFAAKRAEIEAKAGVDVEKVRERQSQQLKTLQQTSTEYEKQNRLRIAAIDFQTEMVGKSEEERQMAEAQRNLYLDYVNQFDKLEQKRQALTKDEQYLNDEILKQQDSLTKQYNKQAQLTTEAVNKLQTANILEKDRQNTLENIVRAYEDQLNLQETIQGILRDIRAEGDKLTFERSLRGLSEYEKTIRRIREESRLLELSRSRQFASQPQFAAEDGMTPERAQQLADGLRQISEATGENTQKNIENYEQSRTWSEGWSESFAKYKDEATNAAEQAKTVFDSATKGMEDAIVKFAMTGKLSFKDLANSILADIIRIQAKRIVTSLFGGGGIFSGLFGGGRASGGAVNADTSYVVGERGPELFVPTSAGKIIPNAALQDQTPTLMSTNVTYNIQAVDAASFRNLVARDPQFLYQVTERGRRSQPTRSR